MQLRRRRRVGPLLLWETGFLAWIGVCYLIVCWRYRLTASPADAGITFAIFSLPALLGGLIAWSLLKAGRQVRAEGRSGGTGLLIAGVLVGLFVVAGVLGLLWMFGAGPG
jgi:hypothetical protein